jgi:hypothetical protein
MSTMKYKVTFFTSGLLCLVLLSSWLFSYKSYGLVAYEAYAGVGTEFASVRGLLVFYRFDNYEGSRPPQSWGCGFVVPGSRGGLRLKNDFDFWQAPYWWSRIGFYFSSSHPFIKQIQVISIPYWYLFVIAVFTCAFSYRRLHFKSKPDDKRAISNAA